MLAKANRLRSADEFRVTMRTGRKVSTATMVLYLKRDLDTVQTRFGFVVAKTVGNAVVRNSVKRRFRALSHQWLSQLPAGSAVVVRALPAAGQADWHKLSTDFNSAIARGFEGEIQR
ncbi:MAG: ribonuclease P protein component [Micrococcales bacterium]